MATQRKEVRDIDTINELVEYLKRNIAKGYKLDQLRWALMSQGHSRTAIDRAVQHVQEIEDARHSKEQITKVTIKEPVIERFEIQEEKKSFWQKIKDSFS